MDKEETAWTTVIATLFVTPSPRNCHAMSVTGIRKGRDDIAPGDVIDVAGAFATVEEVSWHYGTSPETPPEKYAVAFGWRSGPCATAEEAAAYLDWLSYSGWHVEVEMGPAATYTREPVIRWAQYRARLRAAEAERMARPLAGKEEDGGR